eukprot:TRINITY_DN7866_c0_g1_i3.p1 TRINITY_DN7866_c0_g1~~TRINITY_DN7866_c0_g1_i3.p1  ORF type:complete len:786 (+),score=97.83 TRINITY_DN7866_c0_g1_i3:85-2442(+)
MSKLRQVVSGKKKRFQQCGFDLDLSYITDRIIAMGFPAEAVEGIYRNPMSEVVRFLDTQHKDHYKVYNLCSERKYESSRFHERVAVYPFDDHCPPPFDIIETFCQDVRAWLDLHPENVIAIHCKAGKGRTGTMISCLLLSLGSYPTASNALQYFALQRTLNGEGVTIPSQRRYVEYYETSLKKQVTQRVLALHRIRMHSIPNFKLIGGCDPYIAIVQRGNSVFHARPIADAKGRDVIDFDCRNTCIWKDVKIEFFHQNFTKGKMFHFWINTAFVKSKVITFWRRDLDLACKDIQGKHFSAGFRIDIFFKEVEEAKKEAIMTPSGEIMKPSAPLVTLVDQRILDLQESRDRSQTTDTTNEFSSPLNMTMELRPESATFEEVCGKCRQRITIEDFFLAHKGEMYHTNCLSCEKCACTLQGTEIVVREDGKLICSRCERGFFQTCGGCGKTATKQPLANIMGQTFHRDCIICQGCNRNLKWAGYRVLQGHIFCPEGCAGMSSILESLKVHPQETMVPQVCSVYSDDEGDTMTEVRIDSKLGELTRYIEQLKISKDPALGVGPPLADSSTSSVQNGKGDAFDKDPSKQTASLSKDSPSKTSTAADRAGKVFCVVCDLDLTLRPDIKFHKGKPYCMLDFTISQLDSCAHCTNTIDEEEGVFARNRRWHSNHLFCDVCHIPCGEKITTAGTDDYENGFIEVNGEVFCKTHGEYRICSTCDQKMVICKGEIIVAGQGFFHKECFRCSKCRRTIFGDYLAALDRVYHTTCFVCAVCSNPFPDVRSRSFLYSMY